jgi:hypothetical protein
MRVLDRANLLPLLYEIERAANDILSRSCSDRRVSKSWVHRFIKRLPKTFKFQTQKTMEAKRADAKRLPTIIEWFHKLGGQIDSLKLGPRNIYSALCWIIVTLWQALTALAGEGLLRPGGGYTKSGSFRHGLISLHALATFPHGPIHSLS